jgi:hypothetical protein
MMPLIVFCSQKTIRRTILQDERKTHLVTCLDCLGGHDSAFVGMGYDHHEPVKS